MHHRACVALAWAHSELHELVAQQRAVVLGMLAKTLLRKLLELAGLLGEVIDIQIPPVFCGINLLTVSIDGSYQYLERPRRVS
jgi:hypothetical protein